MNAYLCFKFSKTDWEALSPRLEGNDESAWAEAIGVFERRMKERFFSCIDALEKADTKPDPASPDSAHTDQCIPGFAIMALCCLLIETIQYFREDVPATTDPEEPCTFPAGRCVKPPSGTNQLFKAFLLRPTFEGAFNGSVAKKFNEGIRNGILHEAETRKWVIWRDEPTDQIVAKEEDGFALNRTLFYAAVKKEFNAYLRELRLPTNEVLRNRFKERMQRLCEKT